MSRTKKEHIDKSEIQMDGRGKEMYQEVVKEQGTQITRGDASTHQGDREAWQSAFHLAPKTKREARRAAAALFGETGSVNQSRNFLTHGNRSCVYGREIEPGKKLIDRGVSFERRKSLERTMHGKTYQSDNSDRVLSKECQPNAARTLASTNFYDSLRRHLFKELRQLQKRERDFLYLEIVDTMKSGNCLVVSFFISGKKEAIKKINKPLTILSFCQNKSRFKYENPAVQQFCDMGWPVARECIESVGHAVERLQEQLKQHGWGQKVW